MNSTNIYEIIIALIIGIVFGFIITIRILGCFIGG